ncbi:MAG: ATP-binding protein, partial [Pseudomonadota bacterium]
LVLIHGRQQRWLTYSVIAAAVTVALLSLPVLATLPNTPQVTPLIYLLAMAATVAVTVAGIIASWRRSTEGLLVAAGLALAFLYGINDWALQSDFIGPENWYLGPYLSLQSFIVFCYLMHRRYIGALVQVEHSNLELAQRLQERENELARSYERLSEIEYRQTVAQERQRLMQDMHDGLGSSLHSALRAIERGKLDEISVADILRGCIDDLHLTIDSMEPVEADLLLLLATLRYRLGSRLQSAGITLHWQVVDVPQLDWLDPRTALHILRILQEALTNIVKHTSATEITVATAQEGAGVTVRIADNGAGFALVPALALGGRGLLNQQRRADAIGGNIGWDSTSAGTTVALWLPLSRNAIPHHLAGTVSPELVTDRLTKSWHKHGFVKP